MYWCNHTQNLTSLRIHADTGVHSTCHIRIQPHTSLDTCPPRRPPSFPYACTHTSRSWIYLPMQPRSTYAVPRRGGRRRCIRRACRTPLGEDCACYVRMCAHTCMRTYETQSCMHIDTDSYTLYACMYICENAFAGYLVFVEQLRKCHLSRCVCA